MLPLFVSFGRIACSVASFSVDFCLFLCMLFACSSGDSGLVQAAALSPTLPLCSRANSFHTIVGVHGGYVDVANISMWHLHNTSGCGMLRREDARIYKGRSARLYSWTFCIFFAHFFMYIVSVCDDFFLTVIIWTV